MRALLAILTMLVCASAANAQGACSYIYQGNVLTPAQWLFCFQQKQDALGFQPVNRNGDTMLGRLVTAVPGANTAGFNLQPGSTPASPANGDVWATTAGLFSHAAGQTYLLTRPSGRLILAATGVNFNASGDTTIAVSLPPSFTRFRVVAVQISNASHTLTTATAGLFTASAGGGVAVVTASSAITVSSTSDAANNNMMQMTVNNSGTESYLLTNQPNLYFRIGTPEGATATADVTIEISPLP